ncbi:hypothetical protein Dimus_008621 [Dionaea muscipula]
MGKPVQKKRTDAYSKLHGFDIHGSSVKDHELPYGDWMSMIFDAFGVPLVGSGENRRRDDDDEVPEEEVEEEEKDQTEFDWEAVIDEVAEQEESGSDDQFFDAQVDAEEPVIETSAAPEVPTVVAQDSAQQKETTPSGVDPSGGPSGHLPEAVMNKLQAEFERARANRFQADLEKAKAENARLLTLLHQAQTKPKP